jgi:hypothetical protein
MRDIMFGSLRDGAMFYYAGTVYYKVAPFEVGVAQYNAIAVYGKQKAWFHDDGIVKTYE